VNENRPERRFGRRRTRDPNRPTIRQRLARRGKLPTARFRGARHAFRGMRGELQRRLRIARIRTFLGPADVLTLVNGLCGLLAIASFAAQAAVLGPGSPFASVPAPYAAAALIGIGLAADAMDGTVARRFGGSRLGGDLDTLCDAITFVCAPSLMVLEVYGTPGYPAFVSSPLPSASAVAAALIFLFGILRLARFNSNPEESETKTFTGLPTPWMAIVVTLLVLVKIPPVWALPLCAILAFLMVSTLAYPKSRGDMVYLTVAILISGAAAVLIIVLLPKLRDTILQGGLVILALGIALWPFFYGRARRRAATQAAVGHARFGPMAPGLRGETPDAGGPGDRTPTGAGRAPVSAETETAPKQTGGPINRLHERPGA
jgi:CDP-diacylglycerol--serine O-phosphatidyltransferase